MISFFNDDFVAVFAVEIDRRERRGDEKRDSEMFRQNRELKSADFVRAVAVFGDSIGADDDAVYSFFFYRRRDRRIGDQRRRDFLVNQLESRQPRALIKRSRFGARI